MNTTILKVAAQVDGQLSLADLTAGMYVLVLEMNDSSLRQVIVKK